MYIPFHFRCSLPLNAPRHVSPVLLLVGLTGLPEAELEEVSDGGGGEAEGAEAALLRPLDEGLGPRGEGQLGLPADLHQARGAGGQGDGVRALGGSRGSQ